jgi:hypothetical protein
MTGAIVLLLAVVFALAAISKMRSRAEFVIVLRHLLPPWCAKPISILIPAGELLLAALLLSGVTLSGALIAVIVVLSVFTIVLFQMHRRGVKGCGCFGESSEEQNVVGGVLRNVLLIGAAGWLLCETEPVTVVGPDISSFLGRITIVIGVLCLGSCLVALTRIYKQFSQPSKT